MSPRTSAATAAPHLAVTGDLHLGQAQTAWRAEAFARWLDALPTRAPDARRWRLVLNGDTFEFLHTPPDGGPKAYARPPDADAACRKLARMIPHMRPALQAIGRFVLRGHEVDIVVGNHDRELLLRPVRRMLRDAIARAVGRPRHALGRRVRFHPWFYHEPGVVWIEHGHQFDEFSSYSEVFPAIPTFDRTTLEEPVSHQAVRHFIYPTRGLMRPEDGERWRFFDFLRWGVRTGPRRALYFLLLYLVMVLRLVVHAARIAAAPREPAERVVRAIRGVARRARIDPSRLLALRGRWRWPPKPAVVLRLFYGDRFLLLGAAAAVVLGVTAAAGIEWSAAVALPGTATGVAIAWVVLDRLRDLDLTRRLRHGARHVHAIVRVPIVVMGHTHEPVADRLGDGDDVYLNPGSWVEPSDEPDDPTAPSPGFVLLLRRDDGTLRVAGGTTPHLGRSPARTPESVQNGTHTTP